MSRIPSKALCLASILLFAVSLLSADEGADEYRQKFGRLAELAGSCWSGKFPNGRTDTHCWEWAMQGRFLRDSHTVESEEGPYTGETLYGWDPTTQLLAFWYFNSLGGVSEGIVVPKGGLLHFEESYEDQAQRSEMRSRMSIESDRSYEMLTERRTKTGWETFLAITYERQAESEDSPNP